jgi:uncharacterized RDD family membrane protein YckC
MAEDAPNATQDVVYAGFLRRWVAIFLDGMILSSAFYGLVFIVMLAAVGAAGLDALNDDEPPAWLVGAYFALMGLYFVMAGLYYALLESSSNQATVGKMALGIKVTDRHGARLGFAHALGRWAAAALSYLTLYIGFLLAAFTERKQALHDLAAGTLVVDKWAFTDHPERQQREVSGCLIAFLVGIGLMVALAVLGILAAIAIPAYADYTGRAKVAEALSAAAPVKLAIAEAAMAGPDCPTNESSGFRAPEAYATAGVASIELGRLEDERCGLIMHLSPELHGDPEQAWIALSYEPEARRWDCWSGLPDGKLPATCRD